MHNRLTAAVAIVPEATTPAGWQAAASTGAMEVLKAIVFSKESSDVSLFRGVNSTER